ncbi:hypothetical protein COLO4_33400 [Corchorus olitorius]|uniref:Uncharacterized protein n=1 Tax=Corchorus olitorius TaxID=93759 RepID=A0A1R3GTV7_9ROSI|nr:hypothetical protein COLO4_33400 [Corchorus olitorius]
MTELVLAPTKAPMLKLYKAWWAGIKESKLLTWHVQTSLGSSQCHSWAAMSR